MDKTSLTAVIQARMESVIRTPTNQTHLSGSNLQLITIDEQNQLPENTLVDKDQLLPILKRLKQSAAGKTEIKTFNSVQCIKLCSNPEIFLVTGKDTKQSGLKTLHTQLNSLLCKMEAEGRLSVLKQNLETFRSAFMKQANFQDYSIFSIGKNKKAEILWVGNTNTIPPVLLRKLRKQFKTIGTGSILYFEKEQMHISKIHTNPPLFLSTVQTVNLFEFSFAALNISQYLGKVQVFNIIEKCKEHARFLNQETGSSAFTLVCLDPDKQPEIIYTQGDNRGDVFIPDNDLLTDLKKYFKNLPAGHTFFLQKDKLLACQFLSCPQIILLGKTKGELLQLSKLVAGIYNQFNKEITGRVFAQQKQSSDDFIKKTLIQEENGCSYLVFSGCAGIAEIIHIQGEQFRNLVQNQQQLTDIRTLFSGKPSGTILTFDLDKIYVCKLCAYPQLYLTGSIKIPPAEFELLAGLLYEYTNFLDLSDRLEEFKDILYSFKVSFTNTDKHTFTADEIIGDFFQYLPEKYKVNRLIVYYEAGIKQEKIVYTMKYNKLAPGKEEKDFVLPINDRFEIPLFSPGVQTGKPLDKRLVSETLNLGKVKDTSFEIYSFNQHKGILICVRNDSECMNLDYRILFDLYIQNFILLLKPAMVFFSYSTKLINAFAADFFDFLCCSNLYIDRMLSTEPGADPKSWNHTLIMFSREIEMVEKQFYKKTQYRLALYKESVVCNIKEVIQETENRFENSLRDYTIIEDIDLFCCITILKQPVIEALFQILLNIIHHAYPTEKYTDKPRIIEITGKQENSVAKLQITDRGEGLPDTVINSIFEPGWKANPASSRPGLGLAFARYVIQDLHEGSITAELNKPKGIALIIRLPLSTCIDRNK